jgi:protein phosphatase
LRDDGVYVVADGIGGDRGGALASKLAVLTIERAFRTKTFEGPVHEELPRGASELASALAMANTEVFLRAADDEAFERMGTTVCAARFVLEKQRLYVGHVGDSRLYRYRAGELRQLTTDHTIPEGKAADAGRLSRAVGVGAAVAIDVLLDRPRAGDVYLLCTDGLTKMIDDAAIAEALRDSAAETTADALVAAANAKGGADNVSVVVLRVGVEADT